MPSSVLGLPAEAAATLVALRVIAHGAGPILLQPEILAARIYPNLPPDMAREVLILHVVMLEDAGYARSWIADGREWLLLTDPWEIPAQEPPSGPLPRPFSPAGEREGEGARARESARERARAQVEAEERERVARWDQWYRDQAQPVSRRPARPSLLDAPPIGCPDHPHGHFEPCGPCGTAAARRREWLARNAYTEQLSIFEEQSGVLDDEEPW